MSSMAQALGSSSLTAQSGGTSLSRPKVTDVYYVAISHEDMVTFRDFYKQKETDVATANSMKDFYSLNHNVEFFFANELLEEERYAIRKPACALMGEARAWHDMYGFCAVYNPQARAARLARQLKAQKSNSLLGVDPRLLRQATSALDTPDLLLEEAKRLIHEVMPENEQETRDVILGSGRVDESSDRTKRRRRETVEAEIVQNPSHSSTRNSGAVMYVNRREPSDDDDNGDELAFAKKEAQVQLKDVSETLQETIISLRSLRVVNLEDGRFYLEIDRSSGASRVVFVRSGVGAIDRTDNDTVADVVNGQSLLIDPDVFVHVWSNRMPFRNGRLNSRMYEVLQRRAELDQADRNAADVDLTRSHPVTILEHVPLTNRLDMDQISDRRLYGGGETPGTATAIDAIKQAAVLDYRLRVSAAYRNKHRDDDEARMISEGRIGKTVLDANGNRVYPRLRRFVTEELPPGFKATTTVQPEITLDTQFLLYRFRLALANTLGVPLPLLDGGTSFSGRSARSTSGSVSNGASQATATIGTDRLRKTILADREILREFIDELWDIMYRPIDNAILENVLNSAAGQTRKASETHLAEMRLIRKRLAVVKDLSQISNMRSDLESRRNEIEAAVSRLRELSSQVRAIVSMRYRFHVEFKSLAFVPPEELQLAVMSGAITPLDQANAIRANFGMAPITQAEFDKVKEDELQTEIRKIDEEAKVHAKYDSKPKAGGQLSKAKPK